MPKFDKDRSAGWWIFKLPGDDPYQAGAGEHDDDAERKARSLPTARSRREGNEALEREWERAIEPLFRPKGDSIMRLWEATRQKVFRAFIWVFQKPARGWRKGRINICYLDERKTCICIKDKERYGNTK